MARKVQGTDRCRRACSMPKRNCPIRVGDESWVSSVDGADELAWCFVAWVLPLLWPILSNCSSLRCKYRRMDD